MITAYEAVEEILARLEKSIEAGMPVGDPTGVESLDAHRRGMTAGLRIAISVVKSERDYAQRLYAPKGEEASQYLFMRLHTPVRKA